jgi:hypothetical protein
MQDICNPTNVSAQPVQMHGTTHNVVVYEIVQTTDAFKASEYMSNMFGGVYHIPACSHRCMFTSAFK